MRAKIALSAIVLASLVVIILSTGHDSFDVTDAVKNGNLVRIQALLEAGANVNQRDKKGRTPIIIASEIGDAILVKLLLAWNADVNVIDSWDRTALLVAAQKADTGILRNLLAAGANPDTANKNNITALIASAQKGNFEGVQLLLDCGAKINAQDSLGWTALMWAVNGKDETIVRLLLGSGADPGIADRETMTALKLAERVSPESELVRLIKKWDPKISAKAKEHNFMPQKVSIDKTRVFKPFIDLGRLVIGNAKAPVTIVEYTDLQCPYCLVGAKVLKSAIVKYGDQVRVIIKHNPLAAHRQAAIAALYFEALVKQDPSKALLFQDLVFERQDGLKDGEPFLKDMARAVDADIAKLEQDIVAEDTKAMIERDLSEVEAFHISGVPVFLVNGVPVYGVPSTEELFHLVDSILAFGEM